MSKVHIVLEYTQLYDGIDNRVDCRVDRVYRTSEGAQSRLKYLERVNAPYTKTYHIIQKTLKGKPPSGKKFVLELIGEYS